MSSEKRGLSSISEGRSDILRVDPRKLHIKNDWNCRDISSAENKEHIETLMLSITEVGVREPLTVYWEDNKAWVADGHCRLLATMQAIKNGADIKTLPVKSELRYSSDADRLFSQQLRNAGKPFTVLEQAKLFKRLLDFGWQQGDIAKKAGMSPARVSQILDYNTMPEGVKTMVQAGQVAPSTAMAVVKAEGSKAEAQLQQGLQQAQAEGKTKVMQKHVAEANGSAPKVNKLSIFLDAMEYSDVNDDDEEVCIIKMPMVKWNAIKDAFKL